MVCAAQPLASADDDIFALLAEAARLEGVATWTNSQYELLSVVCMVQAMSAVNAAAVEDNVEGLTEDGLDILDDPTIPVERRTNECQAAFYAAHVRLGH
jgi:hypothetical protein